MLRLFAFRPHLPGQESAKFDFGAAGFFKHDSGLSEEFERISVASLPICMGLQIRSINLLSSNKIGCSQTSRLDSLTKRFTSSGGQDGVANTNDREKAAKLTVRTFGIYVCDQMVGPFVPFGARAAITGGCYWFVQ